MFMGLDPAHVEQIDPLPTGMQVVPTPEDQGGAMAAMVASLAGIVDERMATPHAGDDIPRQLARASFDGRPVTRDEILNIIQTLFIVGYDTTAGMLTLFAYFLARNEDVQRRIVDDPASCPARSRRSCGCTRSRKSPRTAVSDVDVAGVRIRAGDQVLLPTSLACRTRTASIGLTNFRLTGSRTAIWASGPARTGVWARTSRLMELRVAMEEWLRMVPAFRLPVGYSPQFHAGHVMGLNGLMLEWDA